MKRTIPLLLVVALLFPTVSTVFAGRYYDARIARWLSVDPLTEKYAAWSPYVYTLNNPLRGVDPDGATVWDAVKGGLNAAVGAISPKLGTAPSEYYNGDRGDYRSGYVAVSTAIFIEGAKAGTASLLTAGGEVGALLLAPETGGGSLAAAGGAALTGVVAGALSAHAVENLASGLKSENSNVTSSSNNPGNQELKSEPTTLQTGGRTLKQSTLDKLGLTKGQGKSAIERMKKDVGLRNDFHGKIMSDGSVVDPKSGETVGNLYDYK